MSCHKSPLTKQFPKMLVILTQDLVIFRKYNILNRLCFHSSEPQVCSCQTKYGLPSGCMSLCMFTNRFSYKPCCWERKDVWGVAEGSFGFVFTWKTKSLWFFPISCRCIVGEILFLDTVASIIDTLNFLHIQPQGRPIFLLLAYLSESSRAAEIWEMYYI